MVPLADSFSRSKLQPDSIIQFSAEMEQLVCIQDFQKAAPRLLDRNAFEYFNSGADDEITVKENRNAYLKWILRPRFLRNVSTRNLEINVFGKPVSMPLGISPTAMQALAHPDGEIATARAAAAYNTIYIQSLHSTYSIEDVAGVVPNSRKWFQCCFQKDHKKTFELIHRAEQAGYEALVLSVDTSGFGTRRSNLRLPFHLPPHLRLANLVDSGEQEDGGSTALQHELQKQKMHEHAQQTLEQSLTWEIIPEIRRQTKMKLVLKGIQTPEDAVLAVAHGVDGIFISNHGGRQLDNVMPTIDILPEIVPILVNTQCEIFLDGGITRGSDIFKAIALGAKMALIGRPVLWGLAAGGQEGVEKVLEILKNELDVTLTLTGVSDIRNVNAECVRRLPISKL